MADLSFIQASQLVSLTGADSTGVETYVVNSTTNGELKTSDIGNNGGVNDAIVVGTSAVEAKVGSSVLAERKELIIYHNGSHKLYFGFSSSVTTSNGVPILKDTMLAITVGPNTHIWLISDGTNNDIRIAEIA